MAALRHPPGSAPASVALIDVRLGGLNSGVDLIPRLRLERPELICVLMTAGIDSATAIEAMRRGAYDYFDKAGGPNSLFPVLDRCFDRVALLREREAAYEALRLAKEEAEAASRGKSGFLATISHELRTPLNAIIGFSEMMLREVLGDLGNDQYRAYASDIHESGTHLLQIINDILDLSKAEAGKLELYEDVFDLRDTLQSVRQLIAARICGGGLSDCFEIEASMPLLRADERKTKQVLLNLVTNAVKFTPPGGRVEVAGHFDPEMGVVLRCKDTGIGIARRDLDRVLQPFEQVDFDHAAGRIRAPGSACRSSRRSWTCTAAPSCWKARSGSAPASRSPIRRAGRCLKASSPTARRRRATPPELVAASSRPHSCRQLG